jgi:hypothetical protein
MKKPATGRENPKETSQPVHGRDTGGSLEPLAGRCGARKKGTQPQRYCKAHPVPGKKRCRLHGGKTPSGPNSPHWRTGRYSSALKGAKLLDRYHAARGDAKLTDLRDEIALVDTRVLTLLEAAGTKQDAAQWEEIRECIEQRRRLVDTLARVESDPDKAVPVEQVFTFIRSVSALVLEIVTDKPQASKFLDGLRQLIGRTQVVDAIATPQE